MKEIIGLIICISVFLFVMHALSVSTGGEGLIKDCKEFFINLLDLFKK